jgi:exonuclease SbcC
MLLKKLKIKNIRSYKEGEIEFPEGSTLLMGDIGSGKTSILLAIEFALFGLQPGQKGNSLIRSNENEAYVSLEFEVDDKRVVVERKLEKGSKSIGQTETSITVNNEKFEGSVTEIKNKILSLLNYPPEFTKKTNDLYRFTVYTPQEQMKQIIMETNDTRLNTLRHVFGIDKYKRIEENIETITSRMRQDIRLKEAEMGNIEQKKASIAENQKLLKNQNEKILEIEKQISETKKTREEKQKDLEELTKKINEKKKLEYEIEKSEINLANKKENISSQEREIKSIKEQIEKAGLLKFDEKEIELFKQRIKTHEQMLKEMNENYISTLTNFQNNESRINELKKLKEKISSIDRCTTCLQEVNEEHKKNIVTKATAEIISLESKLSENTKTKNELNTKIEQEKKSLESFKQSLSNLEIIKIRLENLKEKQIRLEQIEKQKSAIINDISLINKHIESLTSMLKDYELYEKKYEEKNKELLEISNKENNFLILRAETNKEIQFLNKQISDLESEIKKIEELGRKLGYMKELEFWLNNKFIELVLYTEKNVMLKLREEFSKLFAEWFSILVSDSISVRLDESFSPLIQQADYELDYEFLSGGERTAVALAYRLALNQTINSLLSKIKTKDIVILDEPTDGFSDSQLDKMRDIFNQLKVRQLILVSHEPKIEGFVDNLIKFRKIEGVTQIEK